MELLSTNVCFDGEHRRYRHTSATLQCAMEFAVFLPPAALGTNGKPVPVLYWLSGLTCTDQNFMQKAGAQKLAAKLGLAIVCPDTSPRGLNLPGEDDSYDFGSGAGFYVNATEQPWAPHYRMYDYVVKELPQLVESELPLSGERAVSGHSMGGHGALICALKNPGFYKSVSAFAPIANPMACPWGQKAFTAYLGDDKSVWEAHDTVCLINASKARTPMLVDQGLDDNFLAEQLKPEALQHAAEANQYPLTLRQHEGYDHSYYFIASFIGDHLRFHADHF